MRSLLIFLVSSLIFSGCSSGELDPDTSTESEIAIPERLQDLENLTVLPANAEPQFEIELIEETNYGDKYSEEVYLGFISDFAVDDRGRVYLADSSNDQIHVYNSDGSFLQSIGRSGRGPGEFLSEYGGGLEIGVNEDFLSVYDDNNQRVSRFSLETYELVDLVNLEQQYWSHIEEISGRRPTGFNFRNDSLYPVHFRITNAAVSESGQRAALETRSFFYLFNYDMKPVSDKILEYGHPELQSSGSSRLLSAVTFPLTNRYLSAFSESGHIYKAYSDEFLIRIYQPDGTYSRSIFSPLEGVPFTGEDRQKLLEINPRFSRSFYELNVPGQWPLLNLLTADDQNRLWVSLITDSMDSTEWWVLTEEGNLLARFNWPRKLLNNAPGLQSKYYVIKNDALYFLDTDPLNLSTQTVIKYRFELTPVEESYTDSGS